MHAEWNAGAAERWQVDTAPVTLPEVGGKEEALQRQVMRPDWLDDDGRIALEDLDSEDDMEEDSERASGEEPLTRRRILPRAKASMNSCQSREIDE